MDLPSDDSLSLLTYESTVVEIGILGRVGVGKTTLIRNSCEGPSPWDDTRYVYLSASRPDVTISVVEAEEDFRDVGSMLGSVAHADCFVLCVSAGDPQSVVDVEEIWIPFFLGCFENAFIIVACCKGDLIDEQEILFSEDIASELVGVYRSEEHPARFVEIRDFITCSRLNRTGYEKVMEAAVNLALTTAYDY